MPTLAEEHPDYSSQVDVYLAKHCQKRLPWGSIVSGGHLTFNRTSAERIRRAELGEVAIALLEARGVSLERLESTLDASKWNMTPEELYRLSWASQDSHHNSCSTAPGPLETVDLDDNSRLPTENIGPNPCAEIPLEGFDPYRPFQQPGSAALDGLDDDEFMKAMGETTAENS